MVQKGDTFLTINKEDLKKVGGNIRLLFWYSLLKDYSFRFSKDRMGFVRVPTKIISDDCMTNRTQIWRYNKLLADKGLIVLDNVHRGGRTWVGYKFV